MREECTSKNPYSSQRAKEKPNSKWWHREAHVVLNSQKDGYPNGDFVLI